MKRPGKTLWRPTAWRHRARKAATAVEMALIAPVFFMFILGVVEFSLMQTAQQLLENATFNASRLGKTGYSTATQTQAQVVNDVVKNELHSFGTFFDTDKVTMTSVSYNSFGEIGGAGTAGMGTAQQIVVYTITYPWKLFTPMLSQAIGTDGVFNLTSRIVVRNEPYAN